MNIVEINNLTKRFNDKLVLDNVSLSIKKGEIFGLLGPNGAGKSTMINILSGILKIDKGSVVICNHDIVKEPLKAKEKMGVVPQEISLFENLNARDNLEYFGSLYGLKGELLKERINEAIKIAALKEHEKKIVKHYSGGMKRRLNIVASMMHHPEILIMDEPTVGVDPQSRNHIFEVVKNMNKNFNTTIIYTSHYMEEIEALCNNLIILDLGKKIAYGSKEELKRMIVTDKIIKIKASNGLEKFLFYVRSLSDIKAAEIDSDEMKIIANEKFMLSELIEIVNNYDIGIKSIEICEPNLEEVFLTLTGKNLRDKEE